MNSENEFLTSSSKFRDYILFEPIRQGADQLKIISGYATPAMASWHITEIKEQFRKPIGITLIIGMSQTGNISMDAHEGFKDIMDITQNGKSNELPLSKFLCQYVTEGVPVHSKLFLWERRGIPFKAFVGSADYTQIAFSSLRREVLHECNPEIAFQYFDCIEADTIYCNHSEIEENVIISSFRSVLQQEELSPVSIKGLGVQQRTLSLLSRSGETGKRSGLNWGQRKGREPNQAYIPVPISIARSGFFPLGKKHFSVLTDDGKNLILRVEQENNKAITTPLNNSHIGEYFRKRIGVANGAYVWKQDLVNYGRTYVTFYKLDEEQFYMDFSV